ncbi:hypothetical protein SLEP1_g10834 [Rubroshorea leprosula]|uniref:Uncharacterized protein n=1 Tax=Rubroshorea leprosula TaxID=152421 RepID=A0AAV5IH96_9ROSI|nr:hypothetical protein SLEP1_g10834 [Rubroshorea leprosula]
MAGFLSSSLSTLPSASQDLLKGRHPKKSASCRISSLAASKRASNLLALGSANTEIFSINWGHHHCLTATSEQFGEIISSCLHVCCCSHMIITGYWVGPDIDDGWGFVEAFLDQST